MTIGHYVSPAHLQQFRSPALGGLMFAVRKSDVQSFPCDPERACRIGENGPGPTVVFDQAAEAFLAQVDANYDASLAKLRDGRVDRDCVLAIGGFAAWVICCAPAAMRLHQAPLEEMIAAEATPPAGGAGDRKSPPAVSIDALYDRIALWGNSPWQILLNRDATTPFFTSDYPIVLEARDAFLANWIVPLAPDLAVRVIPDIRLRGTRPDLSFSKFAFQPQVPRRNELVEINRLIVRSAEDMVFYRDDRSWIADFIAKNRHYRIEAVAQRIPYGEGYFNAATQRIVAYRADADRDAHGDAAG
ncbi:MAG TPA: hypothetical protein VNF04_04225 [Stellaceae bacterium]|nr:hypothetical protein [Stellaceae bacterium]